MQSKPNIVFLMTDQQRFDAIGYQNPSVKTPNLDKLSANGVRFTQAVCQAPLCVASRYSMMLGLYPFQTGLRHNQQMCLADNELPLPVLPQRFQDAGYDTAGIGKTHWYVIPRGHKVEPDKTTRGFAYRAQRYSGKSHWEKGAVIRQSDAYTEKLGQECGNHGSGGQGIGGYQGNTSEVPADKHAETWLTERALEYLDTKATSNDPFLLYLSFDAPHPGFNVPAEYEKMYNIDDIPDRIIQQDGELIDHAWPTVPTLEAVKDEWGRMTPMQRKRTTLRYYALCTYVDHLFGQVIKKIDEIGKKDNTLFVFTADHGEMLGDRNHRFSKCCLYEGSVRVPLFFAGAGVPDDLKGTVDTKHAELVDILPTLMSVAGLEKDIHLPGVNLLGGPRKNASFSEYHGQGYEERQYGPAWMWRTDKWKLILHTPCWAKDTVSEIDKAVGELYDLENDPVELHNLYDDSRFSEIRNKLIHELLLNTMSTSSRYPYQFSVMPFE